MLRATSRWYELIGGDEQDLPLDEAAMLIAAHADPALDVAAELSRLDLLADQVGTGDAAHICGVLFRTLEYRGDRDNYDDPRNSYLDQVLTRRLGIPISLAVLLIEVARRCGASLEGVGMPGHYLVRDPDSPSLLIDPFGGGRRLNHAACEALLQAAVGPEARLQPTMLAATGKVATLSRMLTNLDRSFARRRDHRSIAWVTTLRIGLPDRSIAERLELARRAAGLGWFDRAAGLIESVTDEPSVPENLAGRLRSRSARLRAAMN